MRGRAARGRAVLHTKWEIRREGGRQRESSCSDAHAVGTSATGEVHCCANSIYFVCSPEVYRYSFPLFPVATLWTFRQLVNTLWTLRQLAKFTVAQIAYIAFAFPRQTPLVSPLFRSPRCGRPGNWRNSLLRE